MNTKADALWVGLLTEAGEVAWPNYKRIAIGKTRPVCVKFVLEIDEPATLDTFCLIGLYSDETGGKCVKLTAVIHDDNPITNKDDSVSFSIE